MGERDDLIAQARDVVEAKLAGGTPWGMKDAAVEILVDAGWRPPHLRPHASRCQLDTDHEGDCTWPEKPPAEPLFEGCIYSYGAGADTNSVTLLLDPGGNDGPGTGTEVAVYRKGARPAPAGPTDPPADLDAAVRRVWTALGYDDLVGEPDGLIGGLDTLGVTAARRRASDAERLSSAFERAIGAGLSEGDVKALLDAGIRPPAVPSEADLLTEALVRHGIEQPLAGMVGEFLFQDGWGRVDG